VGRSQPAMASPTWYLQQGLQTMSRSCWVPRRRHLCGLSSASPWVNSPVSVAVNRFRTTTASRPGEPPTRASLRVTVAAGPAVTAPLASSNSHREKTQNGGFPHGNCSAAGWGVQKAKRSRARGKTPTALHDPSSCARLRHSPLQERNGSHCLRTPLAVAGRAVADGGLPRPGAPRLPVRQSLLPHLAQLCHLP